MRRRPRLATTLGSAAALVLLAVYTEGTWPLRIGVTVLLVGALLAWWLWSRRAEIAAEMHTDGADEIDLVDGTGTARPAVRTTPPGTAAGDPPARPPSEEETRD